MTAVGNVLDLTRALQAMGLAAENIKLVKKVPKSKMKTKDLSSVAIKNIVGIDLIRAQAKLSAGL